MNENKYATAGWLAVAGALLMLPVLPFGIIVEIMFQKGGFNAPFATVFLLLSVIQPMLVLYGFYRFKAYLNEVFGFHKTDFLIKTIITLLLVMVPLGAIARVVTWSGASEFVQFGFIAVIFIFGVSVGVLSVIFGIRMLELKDSGQQLLKPFAYLHIVGGCLLMTFVLAPFAMLVGGVADLLMGLMLLRKGGEALPEFV